jgi:hypothetical protein
MRAPVKQLAILAAAAATWAGVLGCDDTLGNDKQVRRAIVDAREAAAKGDSGRADALQKLQDAAGNTGASPAASAQAKAVLGAAEVAEAARLQQTVDANGRDIARLVYEIGILGNQIANSNLKVEGYRAQEPSAAREDVKKKIAEVQGGGEKATWITAENANIPTLAAVKQDISRLQGEIAKRQEEAKALEQQRVAAAAEADKNREAADAATGQKRVELVKLAADAAKKAADIATKVDVVQAAIIPLQRDLAVATAQQAAAEKAIESYTKQLASIDAGWKGVEQQIATQAQIGTNVLGAPGAAAPVGEGAEAIANSINEKAAQLQQKLTETAAVFNEADQRLDNAITHYNAAVTSAGELASAVQQKRQGVDRNSPYSKAFDNLTAVVSPATYKLGQAEANQLRGTINASQAISQIGQQRMIETLQPILAAAKLELPAALNQPSLPTEVQRTTDKANATYDEAAKLYLEASDAAPDTSSAKNAARIGRIFSLYGKVMLARATGKAEDAASFLAEATAARDVATENKAVLPAMPVELIVIPTTRPTTAPTTGPATVPAPAAPGAAPTDAAPAPAPAAEPGAAPADAAAPAAPAPADAVEPATPAAPATP